MNFENVSKLDLASASFPFVRRNLGDSGIKNIGAVPSAVSPVLNVIADKIEEKKS